MPAGRLWEGGSHPLGLTSTLGWRLVAPRSSTSLGATHLRQPTPCVPTKYGSVIEI